MMTEKEAYERFSEAGITVANNAVVSRAEVKYVHRDFESYSVRSDENKLVFVYQKKKGKPTKKVTAFASVCHGHVSYFEYAVMTTDVDFRELLRKIKE